MVNLPSGRPFHPNVCACPHLPHGCTFTHRRVFTVRADGKKMHPCGQADASMRMRPCIRTDIGASMRTSSPPFPSIPPRSPCTDRLMRLYGRSKKIKINYFYFFGSCLLEKRGKKLSVFDFYSPRSPSSAGKATRRRRFFRHSSPNHPSKLYSSLRWLNSKVPKPFFPFTPRLIDVDGF
jgi:hypothetical protein